MATSFSSADLSGSNGGQAAQHNRGVVLRAIHGGAPISRAEIAARSGLTKQAIARIVEKLLDEGLVVETGRRHGGRGQPAIELDIAPGGCCAIGANIDRDHLTVLAVDATGVVRGRVHHEKRFLLPHDCVLLIREAWTVFRRKGLIDPARFAGIGLAMPNWLGEFPFPGFPAAYEAWTGFDPAGAFSDLTSRPVFVDNDANAAAAGELRYGLGREIPTFFYILANACVGGSVVLDGRCHSGAGGVGGEVAWLPTSPLSGETTGGLRPFGEIFALFNLFEHLKAHGVSIDEPRQLLALDGRGRALVSEWLRAVSGPFAEAIHRIGLLIDPDAVVIGGRLPVRLLDELLVYVRERLGAHGLDSPPIHRAAVPEDAAALGAAALPLARALMLGTPHAP
jgi:predicted NBD/HSP70 family sugar kinase/biotin operon repressor